MTPFKVVDTHANEYLVVGVNFHMADANPVVQFCMWSFEDNCWMVDNAGKYIPLEVIEDE